VGQTTPFHPPCHSIGEIDRYKEIMSPDNAPILSHAVSVASGVVDTFRGNGPNAASGISGDPCGENDHQLMNSSFTSCPTTPW